MSKKKKPSSQYKTILSFGVIMTSIFATYLFFYSSQKPVLIQSKAASISESANCNDHIYCGAYQSKSACNGSSHDVLDGTTRMGSNKQGRCIWNTFGGCFRKKGYPQDLSRIAPACSTGPSVAVAIVPAPQSNCVKQRGTCADKEHVGCTFGFIAGLCPGSASIQCCKGTLVN